MTNELELEKIKAQLDKASNDLTERIVKFESYLNSLKLGVAVWIPTNEETSIGYLKVEGGKWGIYVKYRPYTNADHVITRLVDGPRGLRLHGYKHLTELVPALLETAKSLTERIEKVLNQEKTNEQVYQLSHNESSTK